MQNTTTYQNEHPVQALSREERLKLEFERDWENGLTPEEFRKYAKEKLREHYAARQRQ
ncbi:hypothetical protein H8784_03975 [Parabacteroides acidifaciens]|uniref:Antitoxin n=1 Tax=Parabacteroides acidifaciens TaxID=2290935 RepID=A0ABR7NXP3_9BACT|nr:hypothetical protein [Parabacteroides acidifaciens]MBC8600875.1 hypothetical protein [Parabacteroides acidifaciens]